MANNLKPGKENTEDWEPGTPKPLKAMVGIAPLSTFPLIVPLPLPHTYLQASLETMLDHIPLHRYEDSLQPCGVQKTRNTVSEYVNYKVKTDEKKKAKQIPPL